MKKPPLIFSLLDTPAFGGAEQYLFSQLQFLQSKGYSIYLATNNTAVFRELGGRLDKNPKTKLAAQKSVAEDFAPTFRLEMAPYRLDAIGNWKGLVKFCLSLPLACGWLVWKLLQLKKRYTVTCYLAGFTDRLVFTPIIKWLGLKLVWVDIAPLEPLFPRLWGIPKHLYMAVKHLPDQIICTSKWTLESLHRSAQIEYDKMTLVYPGITPWTTAQIAAYKRKGALEYKKRNLSEAWVVGFVGRLATENEVDLVIRACALVLQSPKLKNAHKKVRLIIVGDGPMRDEYEQLVNELGIAKYVQFTGFVDEETKRALVSQMNVFTFTRAWDLDGFGMTTIEAMALGVPVITSDFGPQKEVVTDMQTGRLFEPHSWQSLAERILWYLESPKIGEQLAKNGLRTVQNFDQAKQLPKMYAVLKKL